MKIKRLEMKAFGPFTGKVLEFPGDQPGLHVIFGPNETGKSSTLRALKSWLYGFDERTRDNFVHANDQLLVAGLLENNRGDELYFARRKRRKADLLDANDNPMEPDRLSAWLHGVDQNTFEKLFGLDHDSLVQGGIEILEGKGGAGITLFSAGTGITSLRHVLIKLQEESDEIFKGRASKPHLNTALKNFATLKTEIGKASLSSREWKEHDKAFRDAQHELDMQRHKRGELDRERRHLERIQQALKPLSLRKELLKRLEDLEHIRPLPNDFPDRRLESQERLRSARQKLAGAERQLREFSQKADGIQLNTGLLNQAKTVVHLHQGLGEYRKGMKDKPHLEGKRVQEKTTAENFWRRISPDPSLDEAENLRPLLGRRRGILDLGGKLPLLQKTFETAARELRKIQDEKTKVERSFRDLPEAIDMKPLKNTLLQAQRLGDLDSEIIDHAKSLARNMSRFGTELKRIGLWGGTPAQMLGLPLPLNETVHRYVEISRALEEERKNLIQRNKEQEQELKRLSLEIDTIQKGGEVPTEDELDRWRAWRDKGWQLLRRQWLQGEDVTGESKAYNPDLPLPEAYEQNIDHADNTADRLRREAERVHKYADLMAKQAATRKELASLSQEEADLGQRTRKNDDQWRAIWNPCQIAPLSPGEMAAWLSRIEKLRLEAENILQEEGKAETIIQQRRKAREAIEQELAKLNETELLGEALEPRMKAAQDVLERIETSDQKRRTLQSRLDTFAREIPAARNEDSAAKEVVANWRTQWGDALRELGLPEKSSPADVEDFFEALIACLDHLDKAEEFSKRIAGIDRDAGQFTTEIASLLTRVAPELADLPPDQALEQVSGFVERAKEQQTTLTNYRQNVEMAEEEMRQASADLDSAQSELADLCSQADCREPAELAEAEQRWRERSQLETRIKETEEHLAEIAAGKSLDELETLAAEVDPDVLPLQLIELSEELERVIQKISGLDQLVGKEREILGQMDGVSIAAEKAEEAAECLALIRRHADQYTRLRIAAKVLEDEIEGYRSRNQDPVLELASGYFRDLTLRSFDGLRTDMGDKGEQILVGLKNGRHRVAVEGMSAGTRDQLYLALRLASLEHRLNKQEAVPFIVDDILINFDDGRSEATLKALARLAERNQVILFSHHEQVVAATKKIPGHLLRLDSLL